MKAVIRVTMLAILAIAMLGLGGCKKGPSVEDICAKFAEADEVADCVQEVTRELEECTNKDYVLECMGEAETEYAVEGCFESCERAEGGGE